MLYCVFYHPQICSTMSAVLGHLKKPQEHPLSVVPLATDRRQPQLEALEEFKPKRSSNPHGTKTTAGLSTISRSSMPSVMPSTKSTAPPPLPPRRFTIGGSNSQSRVGSWNPSAGGCVGGWMRDVFVFMLFLPSATINKQIVPDIRVIPPLPPQPDEKRFVF